MGKILWIIIIIVVAFALYKTFTQLSGSFKFESLSSIIKLPSLPGASTTTNPVPSAVTGNNGAAVNNPPPANQPPSEPVKPQIVPPPGFSVDQLSPFYSQVRIGSVSAGDFYNPSQFSLSVNSPLKDPIDITGWNLKSSNGDVLIPEAISDYNPSGFASNADILLKNGDYVNFYNSPSPILANLRLNECMGYLNNLYKFNPALPNNCPTPYERQEILSFSGLCQNIILSTNNCSMPAAQQLNNLATYSDQTCKSFINERFSYNGCYQYSHNNANFFSNEWMIWLNGAIILDKNHDLVLLFDKAGLLVDRYYY